ncbi:phosphohydrolase [Halovenus sp. WSH3]|uniref:Phosphohydrolase n=1 Tax=Halovenus carboxidivorans TaxID=2692199 RepID=A0A6B0T9T0_9EURY|nr:phosphohydrolase [Halovenus carboxidivorans]MXR52001.1 phosphohydrolase [Halovenus carboxidivorans]
MSEQRRGDPIGTYTGGEFHPLDPDPERIELPDIANGLANTCRYAGQCQFYYSVGTHSIYVSEELSEHGPTIQLYGLFHDAAEAYISDVPRPVKREIETFERIEQRILAAVWDRLGVDPPTESEWEVVMDADDRLFHYEADTLLAEFEPPSVPDLPYELSACSPERVREQFLDRAEQLRADME